MIQTNRKGINYAENLLDSYLTFETTQTWTVSSGTGSGANSNDVSFYGTKSLKIQNTAPTTDITVTNSTQNTVIVNKTAEALLSFYLYKSSASDEFTGNVKIFKNAVLLDTQTWTLEDSQDAEWYRFVSDQTYSLVTDDVITFTFTFDGDAGFVGAKTIYIDGMMLNPTKRLDSGASPPIYQVPTSTSESFTDPENFVYVNTLDDLPSPSSGAITLLDNYTYYFTQDVDLDGNRLIGGTNTVLLGSSSENCKITSTGLTGGTPLITSVKTLVIRHLTIYDVDTALSLDGTGETMALDWTGVNFDTVQNIGTITECSNFIFSKGAFINSNGLVFDGEIGTIGIDNSLFTSDGVAGNLIEIASSATITRRFRITYSALVITGSTVGIDVDVSANIPNEAYILDTVNFSGGGTYLAGVSITDNKTAFTNCVGIENSSEISQYYMNGNSTATIIGATNTPVKVSGITTDSSLTQKFDNTTSNRSIYDGSRTRIYKVNATLSVESGNTHQIGVYIAKNGSVLGESEVYGTTSGSGRAENIVVQTLVELATTDYVEIWVENATAISNITVTDLNVIIQ